MDKISRFPAQISIFLPFFLLFSICCFLCACFWIFVASKHLIYPNPNLPCRSGELTDRPEHLDISSGMKFLLSNFRRIVSIHFHPDQNLLRFNHCRILFSWAVTTLPLLLSPFPPALSFFLLLSWAVTTFPLLLSPFPPAFCFFVLLSRAVVTLSPFCSPASLAFFCFLSFSRAVVTPLPLLSPYFPDSHCILML